MTPEEIEGIFRALPLEVTYGDINDRVRFFSESEITGGFVRTKTILGRRIPFCHPPRLEKYVMTNVEALKKGQFKYREFWTRLGDRVIRVIIAPVKNREGKLLGTLEIVEDLTDVVNNPEEVKKKILVL
ncbi:putative PAS/PAC sensor protein [Desulfurococcus amylolyticus 1221n]|uniref:Putative PAS/PAC sensor protein n=1 Tax=Desulfurococcus amylolyticus (strain DSM 18924 / JCM 16383 / VKM B-2413 / 1221n) TaxID=490899 RepID=B8D2P7_DESA1|nr:PAS domain-containing protein [Desulfurococcus amylolyticus]ACL10418.1 putative PAS/PAC sensor protein [Desulfurococcus amylolyticus 1221n]